MSKFLSTKYSSGTFNFSMFILRVVFGLLLASHGYNKLIHFSTLRFRFMNFIHLGSTTTLCLVIFAELFCSIFLILGLFTRFACIPIIFMLSVIVFVVNHGHIFGMGERGMLYLAATLTIFLCGPGKISVDGMIGK